MISSRITVGISGASCSGKTTLAKLLRATFPWASVIHQDAYYFPNDPKYHVYLPDVKHFNWDLKTAIDFPRLEGDIQKVLSWQEQQKVSSSQGGDVGLSSFDEKLLHWPNDGFVKKHRPSENEIKHLVKDFSRIPLTILEGHILFDHPSIYGLCSHRYFLTLDQNELFSRRRRRVYNPPNPPGYLEKYVWPAYVSRLMDIKDLPDIQYYNAEAVPLLDMYQQIRQSIALTMAKMLKPEPPYEYSDTRVKADQKGR